MKDESKLRDGIYEQVINKLINSQIEGDDRLAKFDPIDREEAAKVLSKYISEAIEKGLSNMIILSVKTCFTGNLKALHRPSRQQGRDI